MNRTPQEVWKHFKDRARAVGWTYAELCRRAQVHPSTVACWRTGEAWPGTETLHRLSSALEPIEKALKLKTEMSA